MKQFYYRSATNVADTLTFVQPVRKIVVVAGRSAALRISGTSVFFYIPANQVFYLDFQSANSGKGVTSVEIKGFSADQAVDVYISVTEYGSDGDNEWYK